MKQLDLIVDERVPLPGLRPRDERAARVALELLKLSWRQADQARTDPEALSTREWIARFAIGDQVSRPQGWPWVDEG